MAYVNPNYKTKKDLAAAVKAGRAVRVFQPSRMTGSDEDFCGRAGVAVEGPHYPEPHRWYAQVDVSVDGVVTGVR